MIIIGYQGIGKSTLVKKQTDLKYIDLESSNFWIDGKRYDDWYIPYCNIAEDLSRQGYNVFTSSHECVRKQLQKSKEDVFAVVPSIDIKNEWINKLADRYNESNLEKDYKALINATYRYEDNITEMINDIKVTNIIYINHIDYDLSSILNTFFDIYYKNSI